MTQKGSSICSFGFANNRSIKDPTTDEWKEEVSYMSATVFGPQADRLKDRLKKGTPVIVEGRLTMNEYTDKNDQVRRDLRIIASRVQVLMLGEMQNTNNTQTEKTTSDEVIEDDVPF